MEGERILTVLKKRSEGYETVCEDVKSYLSPVLRGKKKHNNALEFEKLELFSLKLFKLCIEQLQKKNDKEEDKIMDIAVLCVDSLLVCGGSSSKAPPLGFEKMLLHFAKWCLNTTTNLPVRCKLGLRVCRELTNRRRDKENKAAEVVNLLKIVYDILWKCALALEQKNQDRSVAKLCLEMRTVALESLILSEKFELCAMFKSVMKVDLRYRKATAAVSGTTSCGCGHKEDKGGGSFSTKVKCSCQKNGKVCLLASDSLNTALEFHSTLEKNCNIPSLIRPSLSCKEFTVGIGYLLHSTLLLLKTSHRRNEGVERLRYTLDLCDQHGELCSQESHLIVTAQANCLQLWNAIREEEGIDFLDNSLLYLNILTESMSDVISSDCHHDNQEAVHWFAESLELIFSCLRKRREVCRVTEREGGPAGDVNLVPRNAFQSFKSFILNSVELLDIILQVHSGSALPTQQEYSIRQNQLVLLSLMADALVDLLSEDEIEILRSSVADPLSPLMAPPHPKKDLADCCMPLIKNSQQIINKAGQNVLSVSEHKWVGNDAHRLGQALCSCDLLKEACQVLEVSCDELTVWCSKAAPMGEGQSSQSKETRLLERFVNLCNVYCLKGDYFDALSTIEKAITSLPTNQITERDTMILLVSQWVRVKRHIAIELSQQFSSDQRPVARSLGSALKRVGGVSDEVRILYLETELDMCQGQSHDTHSLEVAIVQDLLSLHSISDSHSSLLHTAKLTTQLSTICRTCHTSSDCSHAPCDPPMSLLDDTVALLESLVTSLTSSHWRSLSQAHQHLATAYLWKAVCTLEQNVSSVGTAVVMEMAECKEKRIELCISDKERSLMMSDDIIQCLFSAVENWEMMKDKASPLKLPLSEVFHDPVSMFHSLHLTATLCLAHSQPVLALRCLAVLLSVGLSDTSSQLGHQLLPSYNSAVSLYNNLLLSTLGPRPQPFQKPHPLPKSCDMGRREVVEIHCTKMMADLSSARVQLALGNCDDARALLLSMLSDPVLEQASTLTFMFAAKAKLLASEILQQRTFDLKSSDAFFHYINSSDQSGDSDVDHTFRLTPLELAVDAVKIFQKLASHRSVKIASDNDSGTDHQHPTSSEEAELNSGLTEPLADQPPPAGVDQECGMDIGEGDNEPVNKGAVESSLLVSSSVGAWDILIGLMTSLRGVAQLYLEQGIVKEAHHYAREGALLARGLLLPGWFTEFLLLLSEIDSVKGDYELATQYSLQSSKLLESESHCLQLLSTPPAHRHSQDGEKDGDSCVEMTECESFTDEDSFLDHVANLDIHTPPSSPCGTAVIKGTSPLLSLELHPQACLCQVCTNPLSLLHIARLVVQCVNIALWQTKDKLEKDSVSVNKMTNMTDVVGRVGLLAGALISLKEVVRKRIEKCDKVLEGVSLAKAEQPSDHVTRVSGRDSRTRGKGSSRSTKSAPQKRTKKSSKSTSQCPTESSHYSVAIATEFKCVLADIAIAKSECSILMENPKGAIEEAKSALSQLQGEECTDKELCLAIAQLHYQMGVASVQELELNQPVVARQLWEECLRQEEREKTQCAVSGVTTTTRSKSKSARKATARRTKPTTASKSSSARKGSNSDSPVKKTPFSLSLEHFLTCYQLCFPNLPAVMTREACQWVGLLVRAVGGGGGIGDEVSAHFINCGINFTLTHQAVYSMGKKIRKYGSLGSSPVVSKSTRHHIEEIQLTFDTATPTNLSPHDKHLAANNISLLSGRGRLRQGSAHPPILSYTRSLRCLLASDTDVSTLCLGPKTHPSRQNHLIIARVTCGGGDGTNTGRGVTVGVVNLDKDLMLEFNLILSSSAESVSLKERREWWGARGKLDKQLKNLLQRIEDDCLGKSSSLLCPDVTSGQSGFRTAVLVLGRQIQHLPWESLPVLKDHIVCRMPSLPFMAAHSLMLTSSENRDGVVSFDPHSAYFILNPHGDLKNTEKRFANFFSNERGWSGVIGSPPSHEEFAAALQEKDLYVYCGHSVGRFLASSGFQLLDCHATALLAGCSSAKLTANGRCDPTGIPLSYLIAGCPALVGCLWDVTDGEIDRLCHALLKHLLGDDEETTPLPSLVSASRTACKLQWLTGASTIVYGMPVKVGVASDGLS